MKPIADAQARGGRWFLGLWLVAALLAGCGGGGGGGDAPGVGGGGAVSPAPGAGATGLVPPAPAAGQELVADSSALRPIAAGLVWEYRPFTSFGPRGTRVTMQPGTGDRVVERSSDTSLDPVELWRDANGQTLSSVTVETGPGRSVTISGVELPRSLRQGQQFTVYDARTDGIDIALWRVVAGFEDLPLPASITPVRALRIDDRGTVRNGASGAVAQVYGSTWYAPGVGVVRNVVWTDASRVAAETDIRLTGFDGGSRGFGFVNTPAVRFLTQTAQLDDGYVVLSGTDTWVADRNGKLVATGNMVRAPEVPYGIRLLATSAGLRVASLANFASSSIFNLDALDASGRLQGPRLGSMQIEASSADSVPQETAVSLLSHRGSPVIWMVFVETVFRPNFTVDRFLSIQRFDTSGQRLGNRQQLSLANAKLEPPLQLQALPDGLLVLLRNGGVQGQGVLMPEKYRVLELDNTGAPRLDREYQVDTVNVPRARVLVDGSSRWLAWMGEDGLPRAWRLAANGNVVGVAESVASARAALVPWPSGVRDSWPWGVSAAGGRWTIAGTDFAPFTGLQGEQPVPHYVFAIFDPGAGDVSRQPAPSLLRLSSGIVGGPSIEFSDRTLWTVTGSANPSNSGLIQWR